MPNAKRPLNLSATQAAGADVSVLEKTSGLAPVLDEFGELDDILGEIASPAPAKLVDPFDDILGDLAEPAPAKGDDLDDILGEIASPAPAKSADPFDDILGELAESVPSKADELDDILGEIATAVPAKPADPFDDILGELAEPVPAKADQLDDILGEIATPAPAKPVDPFDDILGELAEPAPAKADEFDDILGDIASPPPAKAGDDIEDILGEASQPVAVKSAEPKSRKRTKAAPEPEQPEDVSSDLGTIAPSEPETSEPVGDALEAPMLQTVQGGKRKGLLGAFPPKLGGTRQVSRKAYAAMQAAIVVLGLTAAAEAAVILTHPATVLGAVGHGPPPVVKVTVVPVDYSKVDLERYVGKVRSLSEGGRDMLRHAKVRTAIIGLDGGEQLYKDLRAIAARSPAADRMTIRDDRVTIASCDGPACGDRSFRLVYDIRHEQAAVCTTERYPDGSLTAYGYSINGNSLLPHC